MNDPNIEDSVYGRLLLIHGVSSDIGLARKLDKPASTVHNWKNRGNIPISVCVEVANEHGVSLDWLILGKENVPPVERSDRSAYRVEDGAPVALAEGPGPGLSGITLYDVEGAAGAGRSLDDEPVEGVLYLPTAQLADQGLTPSQVVGVKVRGDSMEPTLADGDWVLIDRSRRDPRQDGVFLLRVSDERRIKRVQRLAGGALYLISDNTHYQPEMIRPEQMREVDILGRCEIRIGRIS